METIKDEMTVVEIGETKYYKQGSPFDEFCPAIEATMKASEGSSCWPPLGWALRLAGISVVPSVGGLFRVNDVSSKATYGRELLHPEFWLDGLAWDAR